MAKKLPEDEFGPNVAYREHSLLDNPRAKAARGDVVAITPCEVPPARPRPAPRALRARTGRGGQRMHAERVPACVRSCSGMRCIRSRSMLCPW
jgi:hypothetical protein